MEPQFAFEVHPSADTLEEFYFGRLSTANAQNLQAHLSQCERCRSALAEAKEFIEVMKKALGDSYDHNTAVPRRRPRMAHMPLTARMAN